MVSDRGRKHSVEDERREEEKQGGGGWLKKKGGVKVAEVSRLVSGGETS